jgi:hypothetical protein
VRREDLHTEKDGGQMADSKGDTHIITRLNGVQAGHGPASAAAVTLSRSSATASSNIAVSFFTDTGLIR